MFYQKKLNNLFLILVLNTANLVGQDTIVPYISDEIIFKDFRNSGKFPWTSYKDTVLAIDAFQSNVDIMLNRVAPIQAFNSENYAQDLRISIRGFGSRSAFGIRGIRMYQDGIPLTSPDGTTQMDEISIFDIQSIDVISSGLNARLGAGSGGAIALKTASYFDGGVLQGRYTSFGGFDVGSKLGFLKNKRKHLISVNHHKFQGKRQFSEAQNTSLYIKSLFEVSPSWSIELISSLYYSPLGQDPGSLTAEEFTKDPYIANVRNVQFDAGEAVNGINLGLKSTLALHPKHSILSTIFYKKRDFNGRLPLERSGYIFLDRNFGGFNHVWQFDASDYFRTSLGQGFEIQSDDRQRFDNKNGTEGDLRLDQNEGINNIFIFQHSEFAKNKWKIQHLLRFDLNKLKLKDDFLIDGNQDGHKSYKNLNTSLGVSFDFTDQYQAFLNGSTMIEIPTLNELTTIDGGFDELLQPEKSIQMEFGQKIRLNQKFDIQMTIFYIKVKDLISPYEKPDQPGRTFYRNISENNRRGIELVGKFKINDYVHFSGNYAYSNFKLLTQNVSNNIFVQPLMPLHRINLLANLDFKGYLNGQFNFAYSSSQFLDDVNNTQVASIYQSHISFNTGQKVGKKFTIGCTIQNLFTLNPYSNFRQNAAFKRYYESASPMHFSVFGQYKFNKQEK